MVKMPVDQIVVLEKVTQRFDEVLAVNQVLLKIARDGFVGRLQRCTAR